MTEMTGSIGTVPWTAPEMLQGTDYNLPVDVYSFGALHFFCILCLPRRYLGSVGFS
jgi:serine/threonine protein kinase